MYLKKVDHVQAISIHAQLFVDVFFVTRILSKMLFTFWCHYSFFLCCSVRVHYAWCLDVFSMNKLIYVTYGFASFIESLSWILLEQVTQWLQRSHSLRWHCRFTWPISMHWSSEFIINFASSAIRHWTYDHELLVSYPIDVLMSFC